MGRILGSNVRNTFSVLDQVSGKEIDLYYRLPSTSERVAYESAKFSVETGAVKNRAIEARQEYGFLILEGFKKGSFQICLEDGSFKDISSDPGDPDYVSDWKEKIKQFASDLIEVLAHRIFEGHPAFSTQGNRDERKN